MEQRCYLRHMFLCPTPSPQLCHPQLHMDAPAGLPRLLPGGRETDLLLSPCHSSSCPGTVIRQSNTWDLIRLKKCQKLKFGGCAGNGSAWHVVAGRCCWVCTSIWWYIYILRPRLCHTIKIAAFFFPLQILPVCLTVFTFPKTPEEVRFLDETVMGRSSLNQFCRKAVVSQCGENIQKDKYSTEYSNT